MLKQLVCRENGSSDVDLSVRVQHALVADFLSRKVHRRYNSESGFRRPSKVGSVRRRPALLRLIRGHSGADPTLPITAASPGVARVARAPDNLAAFIMRKAFAARWHCALAVASLAHFLR